MCDISQELTDDNLRSKGLSKIIKYSQLNQCQDIREYLNQHSRYLIILLEVQRNEGHWICLAIKDPTTLYYFDSYGEGIDKEFGLHIPPQTREQLGERCDRLKQLLNGLPKQVKVEQNHIQYQADGNGINTCGKWCAVFIKCVLKGNMSMNNFHQFINSQKKQFGMSNDEIICKLYDEI
jgi:hypothetical protein